VRYALASLILLATAWYGASDTTNFVNQIYWIVLGIAGTVLLSFGALMFLLDGMREIRGRRLAVMQDLDAALSDAPQTAQVTRDLAVASSQMTHYHRGTCPLVRGKSVPIIGLSVTHLDAGRVPCGVCAP
jgi:hypothetical protein